MEKIQKESVLFTYSTKKLSKTDKVRFHYALKGRNGTKGLLENSGGEHIGSAVINLPKENESIAEAFFEQWDVPFEKRTVVFKDEEK